MTIDIAQDADPGEHFLHFPDPSGNALLLGFVVSDNNELLEKEPNDREETAQEVALPLTINGRIAEPGDRDRFRIKVNPDDDLTFSIVARGVGSKMTDPYVALSRAGGDLVGVGDDGCQQILGKDEECPSYFSSVGRKRKLDPEVSNRFVSKSANDADAAGEYIVQVGDMSMRGGEENNYRLTVRKRTPDFQMGITMAQISASRGAPAKVPVVLLRREGFRGKVEVRATNLPPGWTGRPLILEGDEDSGTLEIVQEQSAVATASIEIVGTAKIGKIELTHVAQLVPYLAEDGFGYVEAPVLKVPVSFVAPALYALALEPVKRGATFDLHKPEPVELNVTIKRAAGFQLPVTIMGESLPAGISLRASEAATGEKAQVSLIADPRLAKPGIYRVALRGTAEVAGELITDLSQSFRIEVRQ
ncbi:MAG: hypothetical protein H7Y20_02960 [Bryobacteraceae bacterium]|nr:hypothetical protein [Bryobacteraceae bacterium]